jgi:hypothetical protein
MPRFPHSGYAIFLLTVSLLNAQESDVENRRVKPPSSSGHFVFSLLPKSLDKNAMVDMTVLGEVTQAGAAQQLPSAQSPVYYVAQAGGFQGAGSMAGEKTPLSDAIALHVQKSLRSGGYTEATGEKKPDVAVIYHWGSEQLYDSDSVRRRALLIGGDAFANELTEALVRQREHNETQRALTGRHTVLITNAHRASRSGLNNVFAARGTTNIGADFAVFSPLERFKQKHENNAMLLEQSFSGIYYVIISAYDYAAMTKGERVLLWRTRMTVDSSGVSFADTMPVLLANAAPYLGKDTGRAGTFSKKMLRSGTVKIGTATVVEDEPQPPRSEEPKSAENPRR